MHFHHRKSALISAQMMFMLALPQTTFHLISLDGNFFWKWDLKKGSRRKTTKHCTSKEGKRQLIWHIIQVKACCTRVLGENSWHKKCTHFQASVTTIERVHFICELSYCCETHLYGRWPLVYLFWFILLK